MKPPDCSDLYDDGRHYDLQNADFTADIPFYSRQIRKYGQPVLELACGTGRITVPLAAEGIRISGLDVSPAMLSVAREKAVQQGVRIDWIQADCRDFKLDERYRLIFFPFNSIAHLHTREDLETCLSRVRDHLDGEGHFIVDLFNPRLDILLRDPSRRYPVADYPDPDGRGTVVVTESNIYDAATQINHIKWYYRIGEEKEERVVENNMRILYPQELDALLHHNGFIIEEKYGDFDESAFASGSPKQLIVCRKRQLE